MTKMLLRTSLSWSLSAAVLVWSLVPPAVQHSHAGGDDRAHAHDRADLGLEAANVHHHVHQADERAHAHSESSAAIVAGGEATHLHFEWLGFRLTLPVDGSSGDESGEPSDPELLFVRVGRTSLDQSHLGTGLDKSPTHLELDAVPTAIAAVRFTVTSSRLPLTSHPLCDRARHERSGVLLA